MLVQRLTEEELGAFVLRVAEERIWFIDLDDPPCVHEK